MHILRGRAAYGWSRCAIDPARTQTRECSATERMKDRKITKPDAPDQPSSSHVAGKSSLLQSDLDKEFTFAPLAGTILFAGVLSVYVMTLHPSVSGGDNGELLGCACELGKR